VLRNRDTDTLTFRQLVGELAALLTYEATRSLELEPVEVETPLERAEQWKVSGKKLAVVPIFRAGLGMLDAVLNLIPVARVGFVGLYRDEETLEPVEYALVLDPMLATGGSLSAACSLLERRGVRRMTVVCLVAAPEGVARLAEDHPDVQVVAAALDRRLNDVGYILPGLGDAGDRLYGTR
jgi:uracil phosphoribosyltransferase